MSEDNMQNEDFNPNEIPSDGNLNDINPAENISGSEVPSEPVEPQGVENYDFAQMHEENYQQDEPTHEVHIDASMHEHEPVTVRPLEFTPFDSVFYIFKLCPNHRRDIKRYIHLHLLAPFLF